MRTQRGVVTAILLGALCVAGAYASAWLPGGAPPWGSWLMVVGLGTVLPGTLLLGAGSSSRLVRLTAIGLAVLLIAGFGAALLLPAEALDGALLFGLPRRAAIVIGGIGLLPVFILPFVYAHDLHAQDLSEERVRALMEECARLRAEGECSVGVDG